MHTHRSGQILWFQHMHKAGGTSIVKLAGLNGLTLYPSHANGNPLDADGEVIPLWELTGEELRCWITECRGRKIDFVATEWGVPDMATLAAHPDVRTVTMLRRPFERFLSNFNYDSLYSFTTAATPRDYADSGPLYASSNYFTRMLCRNFDPAAELTEGDYRRAAENLGLFDLCLVLERNDSLRLLGQRLNWTQTALHANKSKYPWRHRLRLLATGRIAAATRNIVGRKAAPTPELKSWFRERNELDFRLYELAAARAGNLAGE